MKEYVKGYISGINNLEMLLKKEKDTLYRCYFEFGGKVDHDTGVFTKIPDEEYKAKIEVINNHLKLISNIKKEYKSLINTDTYKKSS